jgi:AraC family transcriptional regulator of adaptative response / DNA-3-methyladenine glycosylase II
LSPTAHKIDLDSSGPLELDGMLRFLGDRGVEGVEHLDERSYRRTVPLTNGDAILSIAIGDNGPVGEMTLEEGRDAAEAELRMKRMLDLETDVNAVGAALLSDAMMRPLIERRPGLRIPGTPDPEELAIRAVLGQQVSVTGARTLARRLVVAYGRPLNIDVPGLTHTFPRPADLADASLNEIGMPGARKNAIRSLAGALADGSISLDPEADNTEVRARLVALPGIGPWTADYVAMRALHDPDVFLASDLGVRKALEKMGLPSKPSEAMRASERWRPWRSYAVQYLWSSLG